MCDPLSIASAVATVAGTAMQMQAQNKARKGVNAAIAANGEANDKLRANSRAGVEATAQGFNRETFDANQANETQAVQQKLTDALAGGKLPGEYYGGEQSANTRQYTEQKVSKADAYSQQIADALARMRGFTQAQGTNNRNISRTGEVVAINQNKEQGNNAVLPLQIEAAKSKAHSPLGDILTMAGSAGSAAGLSGAPVLNNAGQNGLPWQTFGNVNPQGGRYMGSFNLI